MPILIAAVAVVAGLCSLDLLLTFGVIRRLREHTSMLSAAGGSPGPVVSLSAGETPRMFSAMTTDGEPVNGAAGLRVVAFFSAGCSACPERVPPFVEYLSSNRIERDEVLAVVVVAGGDSPPPPYLADLAGVVQICVEPADGDVAKAFGVAGFPAFCVLDSRGALVASGLDPSALPEPAAV